MGAEVVNPCWPAPSEGSRLRVNRVCLPLEGPYVCESDKANQSPPREVPVSRYLAMLRGAACHLSNTSSCMCRCLNRAEGAELTRPLSCDTELEVGWLIACLTSQLQGWICLDSCKCKLMRSLAMSIFLCACETWTMTADTQRIQALEMRCFRKLLGISYRDHITNEEVKARIGNAIGSHEDLMTSVK